MSSEHRYTYLSPYCTLFSSSLTIPCSLFFSPPPFLHPLLMYQDIKAINSMPLPGYIVTPVSSVVVNHSTMPHSHTTISQHHTTVSFPYHHISIPYHCLIPIPPYLNTIPCLIPIPPYLNAIPLSQFHTTMFQCCIILLCMHVMLPLVHLAIRTVTINAFPVVITTISLTYRIVAAVPST